jgi:hypothetical protein
MKKTVNFHNNHCCLGERRSFLLVWCDSTATKKAFRQVSIVEKRSTFYQFLGKSDRFRINAVNKNRRNKRGRAFLLRIERTMRMSAVLCRWSLLAKAIRTCLL